MKWLTISEIERRSKTAKGALKVSYEHWNQLYDATAKELREAIVKDKVGITVKYCGLCFYMDYVRASCGKCVFRYFCVRGVGLWSNASNTFGSWYGGYRGGDWHSWKRACKAVRDKLKELME